MTILERIFHRSRRASIAKLFLVGSCFAATTSLLLSISDNSELMGARLMSHQPMVQHLLTNETLSTTRSKTINFRLEPTEFVSEVTNCFNDDNCRIYYYHFGKSGGSGLENRMFKVFPPYQDSFMRGKLLKQFQEEPRRFCLAKFSSFQVPSPDFADTIIPTCMKESGGSRAIILVSFREPIQRSLSFIHQMCNKYQRHRSKETRQACSRCSYEHDPAFWKEHIQSFNQDYVDLQAMVNTKTTNASVLSVDMVDLSLLYEKLFVATKHQAFRQPETTNAEATQRCNFGFKSEMFRGLATSSEVYRNLTLAKYA